MVIPPIVNEKGTLSAAKNVNAYLLPLLQDLQRIGPAYKQPDILKFAEISGSVPPEQIGKNACLVCIHMHTLGGTLHIDCVSYNYNPLLSNCSGAGVLVSPIVRNEQGKPVTADPIRCNVVFWAVIFAK